VLDTTRIVERAWELARAGEDPARIAASCQAAIARGLAGMAVGEAARRGARVVGLTGGVACNAAIHETVGALVRAAGLDFVTNRSVPCGDGGISLGQGIYLALSMGWAAPLRG